MLKSYIISLETSVDRNVFPVLSDAITPDDGPVRRCQMQSDNVCSPCCCQTRIRSL